MDSNFSRLKNIVLGILPTAIVLAIIVSSCELLQFRCITIHSPILEFTVTPASDTIRVGDTLTLKLACSSLLKDWKNGNINQFNKDTLFPTFTIYKLYDTIQPLNIDSDFTSAFNYKIETGQFAIGSKLKYEIHNDSLFFEAKIMPTFPGFYCLQIWHNIDTRTEVQSILTIKNSSQDDCTHRLKRIMPNINNGDLTINRAINKGFKLVDGLGQESYKDILWSMQNSSYYFDVVPR